MQGYYFTGDGARRDEDGYYWITGRVDDVINVSGHRIGTAEVESALVGHPLCAEAAVVVSRGFAFAAEWWSKNERVDGASAGLMIGTDWGVAGRMRGLQIGLSAVESSRGMGLSCFQFDRLSAWLAHGTLSPFTWEGAAPGSRAAHIKKTLAPQLPHLLAALPPALLQARHHTRRAYAPTAPSDRPRRPTHIYLCNPPLFLRKSPPPPPQPFDHEIKGQGIYAYCTLMAGQDYPPPESLRKELLAQASS